MNRQRFGYEDITVETAANPLFHFFQVDSLVRTNNNVSWDFSMKNKIQNVFLHTFKQFIIEIN